MTAESSQSDREVCSDHADPLPESAIDSNLPGECISEREVTTLPEAQRKRYPLLRGDGEGVSAGIRPSSREAELSKGPVREDKGDSI
jgi:hypothetical protein